MAFSFLRALMRPHLAGTETLATVWTWAQDARLAAAGAAEGL